MPHLRLLRRRGRHWQRLMCLLHLWVGCALLLAGCSESELAEKKELSIPPTATEGNETWVLAPDAEQLPHAEKTSTVVDSSKIALVCNSQYWSFSADTRLVCLPGVEHAELPVAEVATESVPEQPLGILLAPQALDALQLLPPIEGADTDVPPEVEYDNPAQEIVVEQSAPEPQVAIDVSEKNRPASEMPAYDKLSDEERHLLDLIQRETLDATTGELTDIRLDQQCRDSIAEAYALSQRGAVYAARQQLIEVLRKISQTKDNRDETRGRTESLAAGLRALDEAEDFAPRGFQLEGEMKLEIICAAHRTPLAREIDLAEMLPVQMTERYNRYAQIKLAVAVAGEPAGSMALYALGKLYSQLAATEPEQNPLATRRAVAFQQAALLAHNENYMAAHELGVLLAETGHYPEAQHLLLQVAIEQPNAVVFHNLARVQDALGKHTEAQLCRTEAEQLAQRGRGPKSNIAWVPPHEFSRNQMNTFAPQMASNPSTSPFVWR